jgi:class 3 adenylate cyclase
MCATPVKRKLAAILATDAVGYSKHMSTDEEGTLRILAAHRAVIDGIIEFHEGRIINTAGDSVIAEFGSPVEAVRCAVEIQDALKTRNDSLPEAQRLLFRIGVNLGDVMEKGSDLLGDGVNVAARLESIAEPGGICVSSSVYDQIAGKLDLGFINIGTQSLKNIQRPIQVYRVERGGLRMAAPSAPAPAPPSRGAPVAWAVGGALGSVLIVAAAAWYFGLLPGSRPSDQGAADTELARARAEAEAERRRAEAAAVAAADARRALEEKRAAESRTRAEAEVARVRAEAEASRRRAAAELAAAAEARRAAEASTRASAAPRRPPPPELASRAAPQPPAAPPQRLAARASRSAAPGDYSGSWAAEIACRAFGARPAFTSSIPVSVTDNTFNLRHGEPGKPGSFEVSGTPGPDGQLQLAGDGLAPGSGRRAVAQPYKAAFDASYGGERFEGTGQLGAQDCTLAISRAR